jgi:GT2 family glycosyltransferase
VSGARIAVGDEPALVESIRRFCGDREAGTRSSQLVAAFTPEAWADGIAAAAGAPPALPERPLVTVVTPCLNPGSALRGCLDSVAAQTYTPIEHIVVDGGSTDGTVELLREAGVRFVSERDQGQSDALNKGFRLASGDIVGWLNADDTLEPGAVAAVVGALVREPAAGWAYGDCEIVEPGARSVRRPTTVDGTQSFTERNPVAQPGSFVTRSALDQIGAVDESFHLAMDFDLWLRLVDGGFRGLYVPQVLARFTITADSKTGSQPWSSFLREEALALWKSGRGADAGVKLGAAAAWAAHTAGTSTEAEIDAAARWARARGVRARTRELRAGAALTATLLDPGLRHVVRPEPWLVGPTRRVLLTRARRRLRR